MEPPKKERYAHLLAGNNPQVEADIDEYERLLAERFQDDPSQPPTTEHLIRSDDLERRLKELYDRLFGTTLAH